MRERILTSLFTTVSLGPMLRKPYHHKIVPPNSVQIPFSTMRFSPGKASNVRFVAGHLPVLYYNYVIPRKTRHPMDP